MDSSIKTVLTPYVTSLVSGLPKVCKLPLFDYGVGATIGYYQLALKDVLNYQDLQTEVFHAFRELGNAVICFNMLEQALVRLWLLEFALVICYYVDIFLGSVLTLLPLTEL
eukprot:m.284447 g.284447  ORF g.284447 m.284447 type:complete len:111 (+) comp141189_c0_seq1:1-333(+)